MKIANSSPKPVVLVVLDGFGIAPESRGNAISLAKTPNFVVFKKNYPFTTLQASGIAVGLPWGEPGNSEVGHLTIGAGRILYHHLPRIIFSIHDGSFFKNEAFLKTTNHVKQNRSKLHILGLVSSGSVHSYIDHLYALVELTKQQEVPQVFLHAVTDGKDAPPEGGGKFIHELEKRLKETAPNIAIVSLIGRFYAMDRDEQWGRIQKAYELLVDGIGVPFTDIRSYLEKSYANSVNDQFINPAYRIGEDGKPVGRIGDNDAVIMFDFREDSAREMSEVFVKPGFNLFPKKNIENLLLITMTEYEKGLPAVTAFPPLEINIPLARVISNAGKKQLHIAETEKYAHVTYFFNGWQEKPFVGEDRILIPSVSVPHFDEKPEMMAEEVAKRIIESIDQYDFIVANFANADMVGHTGNLDATIAAIETLDRVVGRVVDATVQKGGICIITADHGNAEQKIDLLSGKPFTGHTANSIPLYLVGNDFRLEKERSEEEIVKRRHDIGGILADIAPTILEIMDLEKPDEMTGKSLLSFLREGRWK